MSKDELVNKYLSAELTPEEEERLLRTIADDAELRAQLKFEFRLREAFSADPVEWEQIIVPEGFSAAVMQQISRREQQDIASPVDQLKKWSESLRELYDVSWRPAYTFAMGVLLTLAVTYPWLDLGSSTSSPELVEMTAEETSVQAVSSAEEEIILRFVYIDEEANTVSVAGDFNNWEPIELTRQTVNGEKVWTGLVPMSRGEHNYMFIKDGKWITDPLATVQRDDGFGNQNAVLYL